MNSKPEKKLTCNCHPLRGCSLGGKCFEVKKLGEGWTCDTSLKWLEVNISSCGFGVHLQEVKEIIKQEKWGRVGLYKILLPPLE